MDKRQISIIAGVSYLVIFFSAIYANFFVLEAILNDPVGTVTTAAMHIRFGVVAFLIAAVFDTVVAWALYKLYEGNPLSSLSTYFRIMHAAIMGLAVYALLETLSQNTAEEIIGQVDIFNNLWLIGLFFFGFHLILLGKIAKNIKVIPYLLMWAGVMYIIDTVAHFTLVNYDQYADVFLTLVAVPSILGEMLFSLWLLFKSGKTDNY